MVTREESGDILADRRSDWYIDILNFGTLQNYDIIFSQIFFFLIPIFFFHPQLISICSFTRLLSMLLIFLSHKYRRLLKIVIKKL